MDQETYKWLGSLGVGGLLAGMMFFYYRKDALQWQDAWRGQSQILIQMVKENTAATAGHTAALAANTAALVSHTATVIALVAKFERERRAGEEDR